MFYWGLYIGFGLSFVLGTFVASANIFGLGWRAGYIIGGVLGMIVGVALIFIRDEWRTVQEFAQSGDEISPLNSEKKLTHAEPEMTSSRIRSALAQFLNPVMIVLFISAAFRHTCEHAVSHVCISLHNIILF